MMEICFKLSPQEKSPLIETNYICHSQLFKKLYAPLNMYYNYTCSVYNFQDNFNNIGIFLENFLEILHLY